MEGDAYGQQADIDRVERQLNGFGSGSCKLFV
jgi:hypothetical protein